MEILPKRTAADKVLRDKAFKIASDQKYDGYQRGLASMVCRFFDEKSQESSRPSSSGLQIANNNENIQLADELHMPIIRKFKKRKVYSSFRYNIWDVDLADMQLLSKFNKGYRFLLFVTHIFSKYAWVISIKAKKVICIISAFKKIIDDSKRKPNKIWVDKGSAHFIIILLKNGYKKMILQCIQ